ncbi:MAG: NahK/ErcS family hybrid sensor histidine kinase/response regulator [Hyphomicrobiaceae bacterium]
MIGGWQVASLAFAYIGGLFALAWLGDRFIRPLKGGQGRPVTYALSLAVYCTSWTFFGSVGLAATTGYDFLPIYLGPILVFVFGGPLIVRIVRLAKSQNITSVADFMAARYGKSPAVAALVTGVAVIGVMPYIALQLKAVASSVETLIGNSPLQGLAESSGLGIDTAFVVAISLAVFAVLFGTRHIDATEHQDGLMLAIAAESVVKLAAFLTVGAYVVFGLFGGLDSFIATTMNSPQLQEVFGRGLNGGVWLTTTLLSAVCILLLPRQFHVTVVENKSEHELRRAAWAFPLYLLLINIFVVPIALAGLLLLPPTVGGADMFVLGLPLQAGSSTIAVIAFLGGLSAATAMVIVESVALAIMICNSFAVPWLVRRQIVTKAPDEDMAQLLLGVRRVAIFAILLLGYLVYRALGQVHGLAAIGLVAFAAIAQLAPAFFGGLFWRRATARGAIAGIIVGFAFWSYTLLVPWIGKAGWLPMSIIDDGPFGIGLLKPQALLYLHFEPLTHGVLWSLLANTVTYALVSLLRQPEPIERLQAHIFVLDDNPRPSPTPAFRLWRTQTTVGDLQQAAGRYLGHERAERSFIEYARSRAIKLSQDQEADLSTLRFTEHLLTSAIGAASARLVMTLLLTRGNVSNQSAMKLLDDATEAIQHSRDLLQSALDQVRHGLTVFDKDMQLICWNRRFRELLDLPPDLGRVGMPLERILRVCAERGDFGPGPVDASVADYLTKLAVTRETFRVHHDASGRIVEIRTAPMPQGGIVTTYSDITERMAAARALERANETLERRVAERTAELLDVNQALKAAKAKADEASQDKTRFLAAASHDILQPLNAARLYASSLAERQPHGTEGQLARNVDASLEAVEEIIGALLDISRLDAGQLKPEIGPVSLAETLEEMRIEFTPMAREKGLELRFVPTETWVLADRRLLRRVLQNLISNALKYTRQGRVLVGCRRAAGHLDILVLDTGPGIPNRKQAIIFKEFQRLEETAAEVQGLGLGLSIVERICRVLDAPILLRSTPGRGTTFGIRLPASVPGVLRKRQEPPLPLAADLGGLQVLCIDNEPQVLAGMATLLAGWGVSTSLAASAGEALRAPNLGHQIPDVILADYHLDGTTGLAAVTTLRQAYGAAIPAVIITADHTAEVQRAIRDAGLAQLRKPLKAAMLRALLSQYAVRRAAAE